jgi:hypothetical protein
MMHIPYKGDAPALADLVAGRVKVLIATPTGVLGQVKEGRVKVLATLLPQRSHLMPDVPTMAETYPGFVYVGWFALVAPSGTPAEAVRRLAVDPHSPPEFRCNGVISNIDDFYEAFEVAEDDALYLKPQQRVRIWN